MDGSAFNDTLMAPSASYNETAEASIDLSHSTSEIVEMIYQMIFFAVGTPINAVALFRSSRASKDGGVESRLVRLSRQLLIAHLMVLSVYCVWRTYWFFNIVWVQGDFLCKVYSVASAFPFHLWSNMVAAIAIDMLCCITSPLSSYRTSTTRVNWLIGCAWAGAIVCSVPMAFFRGTMRIHDTEYEQCYPLVEKFSHETLLGFNYFHVITTFYVPLSIIIGCYTIIFLSLRRQMDQRKRLQDEGQKISSTSGTKARFLRATLAIIATFVLSWLPYQVMALLRVVCESGSSCETTVARLSWLQAILIASTCINPFLYKFGTWKVAKRYSGNGSTIDSTNNNNLLRFQSCANATVLCRTTLVNGSEQTCTTPLFSATPMPLIQYAKRGRFFRRRSSA